MTTADEVQNLLSNVEMNEDRFVDLLTKLIGNVETLQNNPSQVRNRPCPIPSPCMTRVGGRCNVA